MESICLFDRLLEKTFSFSHFSLSITFWEKDLSIGKRMSFESKRLPINYCTRTMQVDLWFSQGQWHERWGYVQQCTPVCLISTGIQTPGSLSNTFEKWSALFSKWRNDIDASCQMTANYTSSSFYTIIYQNQVLLYVKWFRSIARNLLVLYWFPEKIIYDDDK